MNPSFQLRRIRDGDETYDAIMFWCPGCERERDGEKEGGLHMLAITGDSSKHPIWVYEGPLDSPTLTPSILTKFTMAGEEFVCHSYLRKGVFEFLGDCTHALASQHVSAPPLPDWVIKENS